MLVIKLEQEIITSLDEKGTKVDDKAIENTMNKLSEYFPGITPELRLRIYLMYLDNYDISKKAIESLAAEFTDQKYKDIISTKINNILRIKNIEGVRRRTPKMDQTDFEMYKQRTEQSRMEDIMYMPKIAKAVMNASTNSLSLGNFPFVAEAPEGYGKNVGQKLAGISIKKGVMGTSMYNNEKGSEEFWSKPRIILFVIGGISYQELTSLFKLQKTRKIDCPLTVGSDCIMNPKEFINSFDTISTGSDN